MYILYLQQKSYTDTELEGGGPGSHRSSMAGLSLQWATQGRRERHMAFWRSEDLWVVKIFHFLLIFVFHFFWANWIPVILVVISWSLKLPLMWAFRCFTYLSLFPLHTGSSEKLKCTESRLAFRTVCDMSLAIRASCLIMMWAALARAFACSNDLYGCAANESSILLQAHRALPKPKEDTDAKFVRRWKRWRRRIWRRNGPHYYVPETTSTTTSTSTSTSTSTTTGYPVLFLYDTNDCSGDSVSVDLVSSIQPRCTGCWDRCVNGKPQLGGSFQLVGGTGGPAAANYALIAYHCIGGFYYSSAEFDLPNQTIQADAGCQPASPIGGGTIVSCAGTVAPQNQPEFNAACAALTTTITTTAYNGPVLFLYDTNDCSGDNISVDLLSSKQPRCTGCWDRCVNGKPQLGGSFQLVGGTGGPAANYALIAYHCIGGFYYPSAEFDLPNQTIQADAGCQPASPIGGSAIVSCAGTIQAPGNQAELDARCAPLVGTTASTSTS